MRKFKLSAAAVALVLGALLGQSADWPTVGGSPQRTGFQPHEKILNTSTVKDLRLLWRRKLDNQPIGLHALTSPIILGRIITHHGFQELVFVAGSSGAVFAIDADLNRILWSRQLETAALNPDNGCGALTATPVFPSLPANQLDDDEDNPLAPRPVYVLSGSGKVYSLNPMTGTDFSAPFPFLPPNANASDLNVTGNVLYAAISGSCDSIPAGVWATDLSHPDAKPSSFLLDNGNTAGSAGTAIGTDGTVYSVSGKELSNAVLSLAPFKLKLKDYYAPAGVAPLVSTWRQRELIATADSHGSLVLLDAHHLGGATHHEALFHSASLPNGASVSSLTLGEDADRTIWLYAAIRNGNTGRIAAFKLVARQGQLELVPVWDSRNLVAPAPPVTANGVVYALSTGEFTGSAKSASERASLSVPATLYAFDAATGKELYSSGSVVSSFTHSGGLAVANGHVCFGTWDNTLYCFGLPVDL